MLKIYHNPRCKKSCEGLKYLQEKAKDFEVVKYLESGLSNEILNEILLKTNKKPVELVRTQEEFYKTELKGKSFTDDEWKKIIIENPKLLQRPIVIGKYKAVFAQPANTIDELLK
jgi:arsenate reductase (glutaredoxin)